MDIAFCDNDERTLRDAIADAAAGCQRAKVAVAFAKGSGLDAAPIFRQLVQRGSHVQLIAGVDFQLTDLAAVEEFDHPPSEARLYFRGAESNKRAFHPKVYVFEQDHDAVAVVGSSNLTGGGLVDNVEANLVLRAEPEHPVIRRITSFHSQLWASGLAVPVTGEFRERYARLQDRRRAAELALRGDADYERARASLRAAVAEAITTYRADARSRSWLLITSPENYIRCIRGHVWGDEDLRRIRQVRTGDVIFFYVKHPGKYVASMGVVTKPAYEDHSIIWIGDDRVYPFRFHFDLLVEPVRPIGLRPMVPRLDLFDRADDPNYGRRLQAAMKELTPHDCTVLREALAEGNTLGAAS